MNRGESQECLETCGDALSPDDQATIFLLKPGKDSLGLEPWDHLCDWPAAMFLGLPGPLWELCPDTPLAELLAQRFHLIPFIRRDHFQTFAGVTTFAGADFDRIKSPRSALSSTPLLFSSLIVLCLSLIVPISAFSTLPPQFPFSTQSEGAMLLAW
jgi:hypothetical protein